MFPRRDRAALLCTLLLAPWSGCSKSGTSGKGISTGKGISQTRSDAGPRSTPVFSPRPSGSPTLPMADEEVVLPFVGPTESRRITIEADPGVLDVHLSVDTTGSIGDEIDELQTQLERKIVPQLQSRVSNVAFGVSKFADFPLPPFGSPGDSNGRPADEPFVLLTPITSELIAVTSAVARLDQPLGEGGDVPEAGAEALWQIATGKGYTRAGKTLIAPFDGRARVGGGTNGGVGFRDGALRVVLHVTDAPSHSPGDYGADFPGTHSLSEAGAALHDIGAKLVGIVSGACTATDAKVGCDSALHEQARADLEQVAMLTGALGTVPSAGKCPNGVGGKLVPSLDGQCPLVFDVDTAGGGLSDALIDAIVGLVDGIRYKSVSGAASDDPIGFVQAVLPVQVKQTQSGETSPQIADLLPDAKPDGKPDSFIDVRSRANLAFDIELRNDRIAPTDVDQVFRAVVEVVGDGLTMAKRTLRIRVPAAAALVPDSDAGR